MRFFGYYALHSFVNQLKKLFKTWVLVFILVCALIGGLIGFGAAMLDETIEENREPEAIAEVEVEDEVPFELPIEGSALMELIAGGAILALFLFETVSADQNGSKIFLPADVNLLFPSPMKPQSVLMFRLATQLGTALAATIYIMFQLPNMILNLGLSGWAAAAILAAWFSSILIGKLLQVLLYTVCSTKPQFKQYLRKGVYVLCAALAVGFFAYWKSGTLEILPAADRFFNAPITRWVPFWGWLKGMTVCISLQQWGMAAVFFALLAAGSTALVYGIWNINADFYEDAMAKSEETAALMEKARSEKTSGTAATRQRKKERKESLLRDGMKHGWGASVFFHKTMYNRFRFSHFGFLTKTMETYLAAAVGMALAQRYFFEIEGPLPVALTLGVLVFFRAMGNPLAEDTGMDFFRLIPESTWQKLFFSLLGGTVCCLMDLVLPILAASAVLMLNPLKLLIWVPVIVSVDFYATSVVSFIDLSVPASIGKTIKQIITIMFIYFGLLPDIGILAFGIVLGHTLGAAIGSTALNLALGVTAFSLASVFLQPKGRSYTQANTQQDWKSAKRSFSRIGFAIFLTLVIMVVMQNALIYAVLEHFPGFLESTWGIWLVTFAPQYLVAMPLGLLMLRKVPARKPEAGKLGFGRGVKFAFICLFMMYAGNLVGNIITSLIGLAMDSVVENPLMEYVSGGNLPIQILFMVVLAPVIEEFIFRKQLIDRMGRYGGKTAVILSALMFGLYHGNFSQFFYAFALGLAFGYIYLNTGKLRYTIAAHMTINFLGSVFSVQLMEHLPMELLESGEISEDLLTSPWVIGYGLYVIALLVSSIVGLVLLCMNARNLRYPAGELELPKGKRFRISCVNTGMILFFLGCAGMMVLSTIGG